jgi:hypothetical protein
VQRQPSKSRHIQGILSSSKSCSSLHPLIDTTPALRDDRFIMYCISSPDRALTLSCVGRAATTPPGHVQHKCRSQVGRVMREKPSRKAADPSKFLKSWRSAAEWAMDPHLLAPTHGLVRLTRRVAALLPVDDCPTSNRDRLAQTKNFIVAILVKQSIAWHRERSCDLCSPEAKHCMRCGICTAPEHRNVADVSFEYGSLSRGRRNPSS